MSTFVVLRDDNLDLFRWSCRYLGLCNSHHEHCMRLAPLARNDEIEPGSEEEDSTSDE